MELAPIKLNGLEGIIDKRIRVFKFNRETEIKNFIVSSNRKQLVAILPKRFGQINKPFGLRGDKSLNKEIKILTPTKNMHISKYIELSTSAFVKDQLHIFGGSSNKQKVRDSRRSEKH